MAKPLDRGCLGNRLSAMGKSGEKPIIGILGGMCSGKSTVAAEFGKLGCAVIDADEIAHELLGERDVRERVVAAFGKEILNEAGEISRDKLADAVFSDSEKLMLLVVLLHPPVLERIEGLIADYQRDGRVNAIVLDMPLLLEIGWEKRCDRLIFVDCNEQKRRERARKIGLYGENELKVRENFQISLDKKRLVADNTMDNNSGFSELSKQVAETFSNIVDNG